MSAPDYGTGDQPCHLGVQARVAVHKRGDRWIIERKGKTIHSADNVREIVAHLRSLLDRPADV